MTNSEIVAAIRLRGMPADPDLSDSEITEAIAGVQRDLQYEYPLQTYGTFSAFQNQDIYDLFNPVQDLTKSQGVFPGGLSVLEIIWAPAGTTQGLSVFGIAPFLQGMTIMPGEISVYSFNTPSDWWMWDANWSSFVDRFGQQPFQHVSNIPGSPIRLFPMPQTTQQVFVRYKKYRDTLSFQTSAEDESSFLMLVEAQACFTVARKLKMIAGAQMGPMKISDKPALYFQCEGERKWKEGWEFFRRHYYEIGSPIQRS
jgi:hypothetical protein